MRESIMELISEQHRAQRHQLLHSNQYHKAAVEPFSDTVSELINNNNFTSVLDYGSGPASLPGKLTVTHNVNFRCFEPSIPQYERLPEPVEFVVCLDTLSTIEPSHIDTVLDHIASLTTKLAMITICNAPSEHTLSDGRNEYLLQKPPSWWLPKLVDRFQLDHLLKLDNGRYFMLLLPKEKAAVH